MLSTRGAVVASTPQAVKPDSARAISQVKLSGLQKKLAQKVLTDHVDESAFESWDVCPVPPKIVKAEYWAPF